MCISIHLPPSLPLYVHQYSIFTTMLTIFRSYFKKIDKYDFFLVERLSQCLSNIFRLHYREKILDQLILC